jgi:hypothetical protein
MLTRLRSQIGREQHGPPAADAQDRERAAIA